MHLVYVNPYFPPEAHDPDELLRRHHASHDWCAAVLRSGMERVTVVQRFGRSLEFSRDGVDYRMVEDGPPGEFSFVRRAGRVHDIVVSLEPDVVHMNGRPVHLNPLRKRLPHRTAIVWQHHGGGFPRWITRPILQRNLALIDAPFFTSLVEARRWRDAGLFSADREIVEITEASTRFRAQDMLAARKKLGIECGKMLLWVGHLNPNKDPLTILSGFAGIAGKDSGIVLYMLHGSSPLRDRVKAFIQSHALGESVRVVGTRPHDEMELWFSAADYFVIGSHSEGSGFSLLEAVACGCTPVVTDIPAHRALTGEGSVGKLWAPGSAGGFAVALRNALEEQTDRENVRAHFESSLSYDVLGKRAWNAYISVFRKRNELNFGVPGNV